MLFSTLIQALEQGATIITPTNRLQREILWLLSQATSKRLIHKPLCFSYEAWLKQWYQDYYFQHPQDLHFTLIDDWQFKLLWKKTSLKLTEKVPKAYDLQQAMNAVKNCALAMSPPQGSDFLYTPSAEEFQKIWQQVSIVCHQKHLLPPHEIANVLMHCDYAKPAHFQHIIWACFDYLHPQQTQIQAHLKSLGIQQSFFDLNSPFLHTEANDTFQAPEPINTKLLIAQDSQQELQGILQWIKEKRRLGAKRIGVVVPDLSQHIEKLRFVLGQHLPEENIFYSLGLPLTDFPLIRHALALLEIDPQQRLTRSQCRFLLRTPFIHCSKTESGLRNRIYHQNQVLQEPEVPFTAFITAIERQCPQWATMLKNLKPLPLEGSPTEWILAITERWQQFGFPGEHKLEQNNQLILQKLYHVVERLHKSQPFIQRFSHQELLQELDTLCREEIHQPPQNYYGIHIMGWFESSGFCGESLWICHFQSQLIPQPLSFSSILPLHWQKEKAFPRTQSTKEYRIAQQMFQRLLIGQPEVIISYAEHIEQQPQWPSPLLPKGLPTYEMQTPQLIPSVLETVEEQFNIPLKDEEHLKGGISLLASQAKCPFQAFAKYRLHTEELSKEQHGFNALERGQMIHQVLHQLWLKLENQARLLALSSEELQELIEHAIANGLKPYLEFKPYSMDNICHELECEALQEKVHQALETDKKRPPFRILGLEQALDLSIDNWTFALRYDRLDQLDNGDKVLVDYKTRMPSPLPWDKDRPIYPQMLMYALADSSIQGLLFMALGNKKDKPVISGISENVLDIQGVKTSKEDWEKMQQQWFFRLKSLIEEVRAGHCIPESTSQSVCLQCIHQDLCRKNMASEEN